MKNPEISLGRLSFGWKSHIAALGWLDCGFRRPRDFEMAAAQAFLLSQQAKFRLALGWHGFIYYLMFLITVRYSLVEILRVDLDTRLGPVPMSWSGGVLVGACYYLGFFIGAEVGEAAAIRAWGRVLVGTLWGLIGFIAITLFQDTGLSDGGPLVELFGAAITFGVLGGIAFGLGVGAAVGLVMGFLGGLSLPSRSVIFRGDFGLYICMPPLGISGGLALGFVVGLASGIGPRLVMGLCFGLAFGVSIGILTSLNLVTKTSSHVILVFSLMAIAVIGIGTSLGISLGITLGAACLFSYWRVFYLPVHFWNLLNRRIGPYRAHPLLNDQCIHLPLPFLDRLLVRFYEEAPVDGEIEIDRLIDLYPSQRSASLRAKTVIIIRQAALLESLGQVQAALEPLPVGEKGYLSQTQGLRGLAREIAVAAQRLEEAPRGYLRAPYAESLIDKIRIFQSQVGGLQEPLLTELRRAAANWLRVATEKLEQEKSIVPGGRFKPVFRAGEALDREVDAYVPRHGLLVDLEEQIVLTGASSGLILFGRRRTGKSTFLCNLAPRVTATADVAVISMQNPQAFTSITSLQDHLRLVVAAILPENELPPAGGDLLTLEALLVGIERQLTKNGRKLVIALDEYENIDAKIASGNFPADLLAVLRDSMRSHGRIFWIFAGSRSIEDLTGAQWTSHFVGTRQLEMQLFEPAETRELLTEPMKSSSLFKDPQGRPSFALDFWGLEGIERLHREAGGWPHLVQLLAQISVQLVNQEGRAGLDPELFERVCNKAVAEGTVVLTELVEKECRIDGEWDYLLGFRRAEELEPPTNHLIGRSLRRRLLVEETPKGLYRLRVPLMRRWLQQRG